MAGVFLIVPDDRTITSRRVREPSDIDRIIRPDYAVTTIRINKFGDLLHFDAEAADQPDAASFRLTGYLGAIKGLALITGAIEVNGIESPIFQLDEIAELVKFEPDFAPDCAVTPLNVQEPDLLGLWNSLSLHERKIVQRHAIRGSVSSIAEATALCTEYLHQNIDNYRPRPQKSRRS